MNKSTLTAAVLLSLGSAGLAHTAQAATFSNGTVLTVDAGVQLYDAYGNFKNVSPGSWFGMDTNGNLKIAGTERTPLSIGVQGIVIGSAQNAGGYTTHSGPPGDVPGDSSNINAPWSFFGNTGKNYTTVAVTGGNTAGLDLSGWTVTWNSIPTIPMGTGAWGTGYTNGIANIVCYSDSAMTTVSASCSAGEYYKLDYSATVPDGDVSGFGNVKYFLHLEGSISAGPAAAAVADLGAYSGLVLDLSSSKTTSGCSLTSGTISASERGDWWLVAGFLAWLGALRMRFRRQTQS